MLLLSLEDEAKKVFRMQRRAAELLVQHRQQSSPPLVHNHLHNESNALKLQRDLEMWES